MRNDGAAHKHIEAPQSIDKKRGENTILPDCIVGDERISADIPKKRGRAFIYFIKINNAKEAQKADSIGIHLTPMFQKYTIDIYP